MIKASGEEEDKSETERASNNKMNDNI